MDHLPFSHHINPHSLLSPHRNSILTHRNPHSTAAPPLHHHHLHRTQTPPPSSIPHAVTSSLWLRKDGAMVTGSAPMVSTTINLEQSASRSLA
ncbi:hypothetical protein Tco_0937150 [Tanacetum coccineum]|uniref:Uncharacterized protein n=1 Tax=Tanacetum coccineum TaxID=301880 RepID=A0ABQ5DE92_9ASTR